MRWGFMILLLILQGMEGHRFATEKSMQDIVSGDVVVFDFIIFKVEYKNMDWRWDCISSGNHLPTFISKLG